jgi:hypothetical protein
MKEFKCIQGSANLPTDWDVLSENYFQHTAFLSHTEKYNPCQQRYYLCFDDGVFTSGAIVYSLRLDILTFLGVKSPLKMHIVGIPCSVSSQGIFGTPEMMEALKTHIYKVEKGFVLFLNLVEKPLAGLFASGNTLPSIVISNRFNNWDHYVSSLRSGYRRRLKQIIRPDSELRMEKTDCTAFTMVMYDQYLAVYKRSSGKLEKLTFPFFKQLPPEFILSVCYRENQVIGWNISLASQSSYYFFLGGIDYKLNKTYKTYLRLLSSIVKDGIEGNFNCIDLGQTAEIPKMRMGGKPTPLYMEAHHSKPIFNNVLRLFSHLLEYKKKLENTHSLKEGTV